MLDWRASDQDQGRDRHRSADGRRHRGAPSRSARIRARPQPRQDRAHRDRQRKRGNTVTVLVAYASKHGATRQIAERIAATLTASGQAAVAQPVETVDDVAGYSAFVIGGAAYYGHWLKPVTKFVRAHTSALAYRPVWLFSSGPLSTGTADEHGRDLREAATPKELDELREATGARGHRVFFGALDPDGLTLPERAVRRLPAGGDLLPEGDFRDWEDIDVWARGIARELSSSGASVDPAPVSRASGASP